MHKEFRQYFKEIVDCYNFTLVNDDDVLLNFYSAILVGLRNGFNCLFNTYYEVIRYKDGRIKKYIFREKGTGKVKLIIKG